MKNIYKVFIFILILLSSPISYVYADNKDLTSTSGDYTINLRVINTTKGGINNFYVGQKLTDFFIIAPDVKRLNNICLGFAEWENPEYTITLGIQTVNLLFKPNDSDQKVVFNINIEGIKNKLKSSPSSSYVCKGYLNEDVYKKYPEIICTDQDGNRISGKIEYSDIDPSKLGSQIVKWVFTPDNSAYEIKTDSFTIQLIDVNDDITEENKITALTANTIILEKSAIYDINILNKPISASYKWLSSNESVATVNSKNGVVTGIADGEAVITCEITENDGTINTLISNVYVGKDDNFPILNNNELYLEISDKFDVDIENIPKSSSYSFKSSDKTIVSISSKSGKLTALKNGICIITCIVKTTDKQVYVLNCEVEVK